MKRILATLGIVAGLALAAGAHAQSSTFNIPVTVSGCNSPQVSTGSGGITVTCPSSGTPTTPGQLTNCTITATPNPLTVGSLSTFQVACGGTGTIGTIDWSYSGVTGTPAAVGGGYTPSAQGTLTVSATVHEANGGANATATGNFTVNATGSGTPTAGAASCSNFAGTYYTDIGTITPQNVSGQVFTYKLDTSSTYQVSGTGARVIVISFTTPNITTQGTVTLNAVEYPIGPAWKSMWITTSPTDACDFSKAIPLGTTGAVNISFSPVVNGVPGWGSSSPSLRPNTRYYVSVANVQGGNPGVPTCNGSCEMRVSVTGF